VNGKTRGERLAAGIAAGIAKLEATGRYGEASRRKPGADRDRETAEMRAKRKAALARLKTFKE
jgi:hypothetical protein